MQRLGDHIEEERGECQPKQLSVVSRVSTPSAEREQTATLRREHDLLESIRLSGLSEPRRRAAIADLTEQLVEVVVPKRDARRIDSVVHRRMPRPTSWRRQVADGSKLPIGRGHGVGGDITTDSEGPTIAAVPLSVRVATSRRA